LNLALSSRLRYRSSRESHCHRCIVELNNELDARGVMLNLASLVSASIWRSEESDCQRFNIELGSNLITVRDVILNLTVICKLLVYWSVCALEVRDATSLFGEER